VGAPLRGGYPDQAWNHPARGHSVTAAPALHDETGGLQYVYIRGQGADVFQAAG
jgi:hypothetical protein